ncbi:hypothetical protein [Oerskovia flava]|uniref:hypothetical protein n=1 Tax=Oerskovia flava TaxID=2986422 RepID=UPI00223F9012|nr:hypothetical protein [Oerskovia sp. JB1-3-2]
MSEVRESAAPPERNVRSASILRRTREASASEVDVVVDVPEGWEPSEEAYRVAAKILLAAAERARAEENEATAA